MASSLRVAPLRGEVPFTQVIWKRADREQRELYTVDILPYFYHHGKCCKVEHCFASDSPIRRLIVQMHHNFIPQSVIKPDMKIKLRMEGAVNGHPIVIEGDGNGQPFK